MVKSNRQESPKAIEEMEGILASTSALIHWGVERVFEALRADVRAYPGGIEEFAKDFGVAPNTVYCWCNPNHGRQMTLSNFVQFLIVSQGTHTKQAILDVADTFARQREAEANRKLQAIKAKLGHIKEGV